MLSSTLNRKIEASGYSKTELAKKIGLTLNGFSQKLRQVAYTGRKGQQAYCSFTDKEARKLEKILGKETEATKYFKNLSRAASSHARAKDKSRSLGYWGFTKEEKALYAKA